MPVSFEFAMCYCVQPRNCVQISLTPRRDCSSSILFHGPSNAFTSCIMHLRRCVFQAFRMAAALSALQLHSHTTAGHFASTPAPRISQLSRTAERLQRALARRTRNRSPQPVDFQASKDDQHVQPACSTPQRPHFLVWIDDRPVRKGLTDVEIGSTGCRTPGLTGQPVAG